MENQNLTNVKITVADPSAIGLFGLALVTLVASTQKLGLSEGVSFMIPWVVFLGGIAQLYASVQDSKNNNVFGATAFGAYGLFWLGVAATWLIQSGVFGKTLASTVDAKQLGFAFVGFLIFSIFMTVGAMETNRVLFLIFVFIDLLFVGLSLTTFSIAPEATHMLAAISELIVSLLSFYGSGAAVLNSHFGKVVLPVGKPFGIFKNEPQVKLLRNA